MKERMKELSIRNSMIKYIVLYVLMPLFLALTILCFLLQKTTSQGIAEAFQMMFNQNVREIDSAILQSNYASSSVVTYTEYHKLLENYYEASTPYEKHVASKQIEKMILNTDVAIMGSFKGEMMILMNDGRMMRSDRAVDVPENLKELEWYQGMERSGQHPYWHNDINQLFERNDNREFVTFGRALVRYQEEPLGYAVVRIPVTVFQRFKDEERFCNGTIVMFTPDGYIVTGDEEFVSKEEMRSLYRKWEDSGKRQGRYGKYYIMTSNLSSSKNLVMYIGLTHSIFAKSEQILTYLGLFIVAITVLLLVIVRSISDRITKPIVFFAKKVQFIEQNDPTQLKLKENQFKETRDLEEGMLRAQKRIQVLMDEVRQEAIMKEKALFDALKAQINPHFLFNTLNAIRWKASINQDHEVADILSELGVLLGETYKNEDELESIDNAVRILEAYVKIMQTRFGDKIRFFILVPEQIRKYQIPRFCLQPLVENAFIHGMSHAEQGVIVLRGEMQGKTIIMTLIDNGAGLQGKVLDLTKEGEPKRRGITGIGLSNIHKRIRMHYGEGYGLEIDTEIETGFKVSLKIPAMKQEVGQEVKQDESSDRGR